MYANKGKEILKEYHMSESSKSLRKKYPKGSLSPKSSALDRIKGEGKVINSRIKEGKSKMTEKGEDRQNERLTRKNMFAKG